MHERCEKLWKDTMIFLIFLRKDDRYPEDELLTYFSDDPFCSTNFLQRIIPLRITAGNQYSPA